MLVINLISPLSVGHFANESSSMMCKPPWLWKLDEGMFYFMKVKWIALKYYRLLIFGAASFSFSEQFIQPVYLCDEVVLLSRTLLL